MNFKKWLLPEVDKEDVSVVADELDYDPLVTYISFARGIEDPYEIQQFFDKDPEIFEPYELSGMNDAVRRIQVALEEKEKILIFGDYDCDGVTATALLFKYLKEKNANVDYYVPDRQKDGYGINVSVIEEYANKGFTLIITVDNGINAINEVDFANSVDVDVIVTDHHLPQSNLPNAVAVINPHIEDNDYIFKDLCGAGVAFKLICALEEQSADEMINVFGDLVALGTVADIMPLTGENRFYVSEGLKLINKRSNFGIKALAEKSGFGAKRIGTGNISFSLCPRINAAGRIANPKIAVELLLSQNYEEAMQYAESLDQLNLSRQEYETQAFIEACELIERNNYSKDRVIVVDGNHWNIGVIGIVASKIVEKYSKPCFVISSSNDESCVGSGRSLGDFSLFEALKSCKDVLEKFGGHKMAAGLSVKPESIDLFRKTINTYAKTQDIPVTTVKLDCRVKPRILNVAVAKSLRVFEPFGVGNPVPLLGVMEVEIKTITEIGGGKHLRIKFSKENTEFNGLLFGVNAKSFGFAVGSIVDLAVNLDVNVYNNVENASIVIKAIRLAGLNEQQLIEEIIAVEQFEKDDLTTSQAEKIIPLREDIAKVYKFIKASNLLNEQLIENSLVAQIGLAKITISLMILEEMKLICKEIINGIGFYSVEINAKKVDLENSKILQRLKARVGK